MSHRLIASARPRVHHDALDWARRVAANGGAVSRATLRAVSTFCDAIDQAAIRDRFFRLGIFAGSNLSAALVPLFRGPSLTGTQFGNATDTNVNFVSGDYVETGASGGLQGNGTSKYLNTGLAPSALPQVATTHLSAYRGPGVMSNRAMVSVRDATDQYELFRRGDGIHHTLLGKAVVAADFTYSEPGVNNGGHYIATRTSATSLALRRNNAQIASSATSVTPAAPTNAFFVFALNNSGTPDGRFPARLMSYSIGYGLTASQADSFNTAIQAFQTTLGRNV